MKIKILLVSFLVISLSVISIDKLFFTKISMIEVPALLNSMRAKEFCTCYFLLHKGKDYCLQSVKHGYPMFGHMIDDKNKAVRFDLLWASTLAVVDSKKFGCSLK